MWFLKKVAHRWNFHSNIVLDVLTRFQNRFTNFREFFFSHVFSVLSDPPHTVFWRFFENWDIRTVSDNRASVSARNGRKMILGVVLKFFTTFQILEIFWQKHFRALKVKISRFSCWNHISDENWASWCRFDCKKWSEPTQTFYIRLFSIVELISITFNAITAL